MLLLEYGIYVTCLVRWLTVCPCCTPPGSFFPRGFETAHENRVTSAVGFDTLRGVLVQGPACPGCGLRAHLRREGPDRAERQRHPGGFHDR